MTELYYVEDDKSIAENVRAYLETKGFSVSLFSSAQEARKALARQLPALLLLDWNLPDTQGDSFCRRLRSLFPELPVIFITVKDDASDIVSAFDTGADDYITKPFDLAVLHSRITALLRRTQSAEPASSGLRCDSIFLNPDKMQVFLGEEEIHLSPSEYQLLFLLMKNKGRTLTRERLLEELWDSSGNFVNDNTLTVTMKRLREKLHQPPCLKTVRSFGYRMEDLL